MFSIDPNSIQSTASDLNQMFQKHKQHSKKTFDFRTFKAKRFNGRLAAIDGSNHNLTGVNFTLSALRAGYLLYERGELAEENIDPIRAEFISKSNDPELGFEYKYEKYFWTITGEIPNGFIEYDKTIERIRTLMEWEKVKELIYKLGDGDIILFDGSLMSGKISTSHEFYNSLVTEAKEKGISLVGLSKDTSLSLDTASLPVVLLESAKNQHPDQNWYVEYEDSYFIQFSKHKELVFRMDAELPDHIDIETLIKYIADYVIVKSFSFGYPVPLLKVHDRVRISEMELSKCYESVRDELKVYGLPPSLFDQLFNIYHDDLDQLSFGR